MTYTVKPGDTLSLITTRLLGPGHHYNEILALNPQITNPDLIQVGQILTIPGEDVSTTASPSGFKPSRNMLLIGAAAVLAGAALFLLPKKSRQVSVA